MSGTIDEYLEQLARTLPRPLRTQVLAEANDHLRESAAVHGEAEALARFGPARELARAFARTAARRATLRSALLLLLALVPAVLFAFPLPHGLLPPAWGTTPGDVWPDAYAPAAKQDALVLLLVAAAIASAAAAVAATAGRVRLALPLVAFGAASVATAIAVAAILAVEWGASVPHGPSVLWIALYAAAGGLAIAAVLRDLARAVAAEVVAGGAAAPAPS